MEILNKAALVVSLSHRRVIWQPRENDSQRRAHTTFLLGAGVLAFSHARGKTRAAIYTAGFTETVGRSQFRHRNMARDQNRVAVLTRKHPIFPWKSLEFHGRGGGDV